MREYGIQPITHLEMLINSFEVFTAKAQPESVEYDATKDFVLLTWENLVVDKLQNELITGIKDYETPANSNRSKHLTASKVIVRMLETNIQKKREADPEYDHSYDYLDKNFGNIESEKNSDLRRAKYSFRTCMFDRVLQD